MAFVIAPVSGVVPNTPVVASLLPVVEGWCQRRGIFPSQVLLPLSFSTVLGHLTLLGSSVNLLVSDISEQLGYGSLDLFSFTLISLPVWLAEAIYLVMAPRALLPDRGAITDELGSTPKSSSYCTRSAHSSRLGAGGPLTAERSSATSFRRGCAGTATRWRAAASWQTVV